MSNEKGDNDSTGSPFMNFTWGYLGLMGDLVGSMAGAPGGQQISETLDAVKKLIPDIEDQELEDQLEAQKKARWETFSRGNQDIKLLAFIHNNTDETIQLIDTDFEVEDMSECDIPPYSIVTLDAKKDFNSNRLSAVTGRDQTFIKKFFTYGAGDMKCRFDTSMIVKVSFGIIASTLTPTWNHQARSIGRKKLVCTSRLRANAPETPYSYCLDIHIGEE